AFDAIPGQGRARFRAENLPMRDFGTFENSVLNPNPTWVAGHVSFEVTWTGGGVHAKLRDSDFDFGGEYVTGSATITFTAADDGGGTVYVSDQEGQSNPLPAGVGHERNGVFFR